MPNNVLRMSEIVGSRSLRFIINSAVVLLAACGGGKDTKGLMSDAAGHGVKVALLTPGPITDKSWNGSAYAGLMRIKDSLGEIGRAHV